MFLVELTKTSNRLAVLRVNDQSLSCIYVLRWTSWLYCGRISGWQSFYCRCVPQMKLWQIPYRVHPISFQSYTPNWETRALSEPRRMINLSIWPSRLSSIVIKGEAKSGSSTTILSCSFCGIGHKSAGKCHQIPYSIRIFQWFSNGKWWILAMNLSQLFVTHQIVSNATREPRISAEYIVVRYSWESLPARQWELWPLYWSSLRCRLDYEKLKSYLQQFLIPSSTSSLWANFLYLVSSS